MKIERIPIYILLMFTAVYMLFAENTPIWNGLYFVSNYSILTMLFYEHKDRVVKIFGCSISLCILLFSVLKFFISLPEEYLTVLNIFTFFIIAVAFAVLEPK